VRRRGFTLLELSVTLAIAGIIAAAAVSATVAIQRSFSAARTRLDQTNDARAVLEHVLDRVRTAGGGRVRPWQAVAVTCVDDGVFDLPACNGPGHQRRLHVLELEQRGQGVVAAANGATLTIAAPGGVCPISPTNGYGGATPVVIIAPESRLEQNGGASWLTAICAPTAGACGCTLQEPGMAGFNPVPTPGTVTVASLIGGTISRGRSLSYFIDPGTRNLILLKDFNGTGFATRTELAPDVVAFDVSLGYDDNADGELDVFSPTPLAGRMRNLRMVRVGLALAKRSRDGLSVPTTIFGDPVGGVGDRTMSLEGTALVRATGVFQ
jgi:prepilin-type N-terminal cleavage/methylation domain-containing protein